MLTPKDIGGGAEAWPNSWAAIYFWVIVQPVPPYSFGQFGAIHPFSLRIFCKRICPSRVGCSPLSKRSFTSAGREVLKNSRTSSRNAKSSLLNDKSIRFSPLLDRKSTRLNSSHVKISYAVFCLKKKNI